MESGCCCWIERASAIPGVQDSGRVSWCRTRSSPSSSPPHSVYLRGRPQAVDGNRLGTKTAASWTERVHHHLLLCGGFEGLLLINPPELPHADIAGAKLEFLWFLRLGLPVHATSAAGEHRRGWGWRTLGLEAWRLSTRGGRTEGTALDVNERAPPSNRTPIDCRSD